MKSFWMNKNIKRYCLVCGKLLKSDQRKYCSMKCFSIGFKKNHHRCWLGRHHTEESKRKMRKKLKGLKKSKEWRINIGKARKGKPGKAKTGKLVKCKYCNNEFYVQKREIEMGNGIFCTDKCSRLGSRKPREFRICLYCEEKYECKKDSTRKYCSVKCSIDSLRYDLVRRKKHIKSINDGMNKRPTSYEQKIITLKEKHGNKKVPFKYIGDGKELVGYVNPDFIDTLGMNPPLIIEVYHNYCHPDNYEQYRHKNLQVPKQNVLYLSDKDVERKDWEIHCLEQIKTFISKKGKIMRENNG